MRAVKVLIVGAGPCGLGVATEMLESGPGGENDFLLVDQASKAGGWASSQTTPEGFTFDFGGHVLFPHKHYARFAEMLAKLPVQWAASVPKRGVQVNGCFLPYPAQRNLHRLPLMQLVSTLWSAAGASRRKSGDAAGGDTEGSLGGYLKGHFGEYLTSLLMAPLNRKQWAHAPDRLTDVWVKHRSGSATRNVADMDVRRTLANLLRGRDDLGWTPETRVIYPAQGGSGAIWSAVADAIPQEKLLLDVRILSISLRRKTALLSNGETVAWESMVSTMPLDTLLRSLEGEPELAAKASRFVRARSRLFGFGVRGAIPKRYAGLHSCQVTDETVPFWRLNFPMTVSQGNGPEDCFSLLCEMSESASRPAEAAEELRLRVEESLHRMGLLNHPGQELVSRWEYTIEHGYPVPFLGRDALLQEVQPLLEEAGLYSRGRFGTWRYEISNQDHAYMQGYEAARRILFDLPEETYANAVAVNEAATPEARHTPLPKKEPSREGRDVRDVSVPHAVGSL
jgi:protoporphyrinogen oxidase